MWPKEVNMNVTLTTIISLECHMHHCGMSYRLLMVYMHVFCNCLYRYELINEKQKRQSIVHIGIQTLLTRIIERYVTSDDDAARSN